MSGRPRLGIFGWGVVAPRSPDVETFERNLERATSWLEPFQGFGPNSFLVGNPDFDFASYRPWIDERFEPRKFAQLDSKSGGNVKYAIGAFIQALAQNPGMEQTLQELGRLAHVYVGTGLGDFPVAHEVSLEYDRAQRYWNRFWCRPEHNPELASYRAADAAERDRLREQLGCPPDPGPGLPEDEDQELSLIAWSEFWVSGQLSSQPLTAPPLQGASPATPAGEVVR